MQQYHAENLLLIFSPIATHPCKTAICPNNTKCVQLTPGNTALCQGSCDINNGGCPPGEKCSLVNTTDCFVKPCPLTVKCSKSIEVQSLSEGRYCQYTIACLNLLHFLQFLHNSASSGWITAQESTTVLLVVPSPHHLAAIH